MIYQRLFTYSEVTGRSISLKALFRIVNTNDIINLATLNLSTKDVLLVLDKRQ